MTGVLLTDGGGHDALAVNKTNITAPRAEAPGCATIKSKFRHR